MAVQQRLTVIFALMMLLPAVGLSALAWRMVTDQEAVSKMELDGLLQERLADIERPVMQALAGLERSLIVALDGANTEPQGLRALRRAQPVMAQVFMLDVSGHLVFPPDDKTRSASEEAFVKRTLNIWQGRAILYEPPTPEPSGSGLGSGSGSGLVGSLVRRARSSVKIAGDDLLSLAERRSQGWITWYWQDGLRLLFWRRSAQGGVIGAEVERVVVLSHILGALSQLGGGEDRITLVDSRGDAVQQWGPYEPAKGVQPSARLRLPHPLEGLSLRYFLSPTRDSALKGASTPWGTALAVLSVFGVIFGLGLYAYRESSRHVREALQRVNFVTQVSHELKTPLSNIRLYAELLEDELDEEDPAHKRVGIIVSESQRLARLIDNVLVFAKVRRGTHRVEPVAMTVDDAVSRVLVQFGPALDVKGIDVQVDLQAPGPCLADPDAVEQVVANLVSNVDKYGAAGGVLIVRTHQDENSTRVVVGDRGPGIKPQARARVFEPFYRVSEDLSDGVTGTGIGLAIASELAAETGGQLALLDEGPGAWFELRLSTLQEES